MKVNNKKIITIIILSLILISFGYLYQNYDLLNKGTIVDENDVVFSDSFSYHPSDDITQGTDRMLWVITETSGGDYDSGYRDEAYPSTFDKPYRKVLYLYGKYWGSANPASVAVKMPNDIPSDYWAFNSLYTADSNTDSKYLKFYLYDADDNLLVSKDVFGAEGFYEIIASNGNAYYYIDGDLQGSLGACSVTPAYMKFKVYNLGSGSWCTIEWKLDSVSTTGNTIGVGTSENPAKWIDKNSNSEIDVDWTFRTLDPYNEWQDYTYQLKVKYLETNQYINTTTLNTTSVPHGVEVFDRDVLFGEYDYGLYEFTTWKDGNLMTKEYLEYLPIGESPSYNNILIIVNSNNEANIDDEDATGDVTNYYGNVHLTPDINPSKNYPVSINFTETTTTPLTLTFEGNGDITSLPLTVNGLDEYGSCDVLLNDVKIDSYVNGTFEYNLTSFDSSVLKFVKEGSSSSSGSSSSGGSSIKYVYVESEDINATDSLTSSDSGFTNINTTIGYTDVIQKIDNGFGFLIGCIILAGAILYHKKKK